jgi:hypothetical protein
MLDRIQSLRALAKTSHDARARYKVLWMGQRLRRSTRVGWWDLCTPLHKTKARTLVATPISQPSNTPTTNNADLLQPGIYDEPTPKPSLPPVFPSGPLNHIRRRTLVRMPQTGNKLMPKKWSAYLRPRRYDPSCMTISLKHDDRHQSERTSCHTLYAWIHHQASSPCPTTRSQECDNNGDISQTTNRLKRKQPPSTKIPSHPPHNNPNYKS